MNSRLQKHYLLNNKLLLFTTTILLVNDFYLKYEYHNFITGKISDFVGLFAFPFFISIFYRNRIKQIYILTGIAFIFWKSEVSQPIIEFFWQFNIGINRTIDYTDLIALLILPISYEYRITVKKHNKHFHIPNKLVIVFCCFAFMATSLPRTYTPINKKSLISIELGLPIDSIVNSTESYLFNIDEDKYQLIVKIPNSTSEIIYLARINQIDTNNSVIELDSVQNIVTFGELFFGVRKRELEFIENLTFEEMENIFREEFNPKN